MIGKYSIALILVTIVAAQATEEPAGILEDHIKNGTQKINAFKTESQKNVGATKSKITECRNFFNTSVQHFKNELNSGRITSLEKVDMITRKFVGEATDKGKGIATFRCLLKAKTETVVTLDQNSENGVKCLNNNLIKSNAEISETSDQVALIESTTTGLYDELIRNLQKCENVECVTKLVHRAESRKSNLGNVMNMYNGKVSDLRTQFNQACMGCIRSAQGGFDGAVRNCENRMKGC